MEALTELRAALATDPDPDLRAIARRWAEAVDDSEVRDALVQVAVYAAPHLECQLRGQAHRHFNDVVATDNLKGQPSIPPGPGQPANQSAKWAGRARNRDALNQVYERKLNVPGRGYRKFGCCISDDLWAVGARHRILAKRVTGKAEYYEHLALRMTQLGAATVADLPPEELVGS
jgi:hypothetical protein